MHIAVAAEPTPLIELAVNIISRVLRDRASLTTTRTSGSADVLLDIDNALSDESYAIDDQPDGVRIVGGDDRGLLYGIGRWLRDLHHDDAGWRHGPWRGRSAPHTAARGIYFATHFWNYYDQAPIEEIQTYLEDLALWGCNGLKVWFDMHHFQGIDDPDAQAKINRLRRILQHASRLGMDLWLASLSNEAYDSSPEHLRADFTSGHDGYFADPVGHYHRELCPSKPEAMELLMRWRGEVFDAFADLDIRYVSMSSYDQGGCTCSSCAPWGVSGLLKVGRAYSDLAAKKFPGVKVIMSTWRFDVFTRGEWAGLHRAFAQRPDWLDILSVDLADLDHVIPKAPGGLDVFCMPEISMHAMLPWGGYGANPMPRRIKQYWDQAADHVQGSFPYSEGIYEDLNKIVALQLLWSPRRDVQDIVGEYARFYFGPHAAEPVTRAADIMEANLGHCAYIVQDDRKFSTYRGPLRSFKPDRPWRLEHHVNQPLKDADRCYDLLREAEGSLPPAVRESWRWQVLMLRATVDRELARGCDDNETIRACCGRLTDLYHAHRCEKPCVVPPVAARYEKMFRKPIELWL